MLFSSLFAEEEVRTIRNMTFYDVLMAVISAEAGDMQKEVFFWRDGKNAPRFVSIWDVRYQSRDFDG